MKLRKIVLLCIIFICFHLKGNAQVFCVFCYSQNEAISNNTTNFILNGGFEANDCVGLIPGYFCPVSGYYECDLTSWTCTGGGSATYASKMDVFSTIIPEGNSAAYLGNWYCNPCSNNADDLSCITLGDSCAVEGIPANFPVNGVGYGGSTGVSISQTVSGLTIGKAYVLEFWSGGEGGSGYFTDEGIFGVDVGFGNIMLANKPTNAGSTDVGIRYIIEFRATSTNHTIKFTNWGHICSSCTEAIFDDIRLYPIAELSPLVSACATDYFNLTVTQSTISCFGANDGIVIANVEGNTGPFSYSWSPGGSTNDTLSNLGPGTYVVTITDSNGNSKTDSVQIIEPQLLVIDINATQDSICTGTSIQFSSNTIGGTPTYSYQWSTNTNDTLSGIDLFPLTTDYIVLSATDSNNCIAYDSLLVTVFPIPDISSSPDTCICFGSSIVLTATGTPSYQWNTGETNSNITVSPQDSFMYHVSYTNGICSDEDSTFVCVNPTPIVVASGDTTIVDGGSTFLSATGTGPFVWNFPNTLSCNPCANPEASPENTTIYVVTSTNSYGCSAQDQVTIVVYDNLIIPNIITINGDGINDHFYIKGLKNGSKLSLFNRWGNEIFTSDSYLNNWMAEVNDGVYFYILITPEGESYHGFFHVTGN